MKNVYILILITLFTACGNKTDITVLQFKELLQDSSVQLIDVRTPQEFRTGYLPKAILLDWQNKTDFTAKIQKVNPQKTTAVYCKSGVRSGQAAAYLLKKGFAKVYTLNGGIDAWVDAEMKIVSGE